MDYRIDFGKFGVQAAAHGPVTKQLESLIQEFLSTKLNDKAKAEIITVCMDYVRNDPEGFRKGVEFMQYVVSDVKASFEKLNSD